MLHTSFSMHGLFLILEGNSATPYAASCVPFAFLYVDQQ
jgi:hypothetical protein